MKEEKGQLCANRRSFEKSKKSLTVAFGSAQQGYSPMRNYLVGKPVVNVMLTAKLAVIHLLAAYEMMKAFVRRRGVQRHCYPRHEMLHQKDQREHKNSCSRLGDAV